ncbi:MAG: leucyl aminopeptidase family protein [Planctomycetota bacterium]
MTTPPIAVPADPDLATMPPPIEVATDATIGARVLLAPAPSDPPTPLADEAAAWSDLLAYQEWRGRPGQVILAPPAADGEARLGIAGLGPTPDTPASDAEDAQTSRLDAIRAAAAAGARALADTPIAGLVLTVDPQFTNGLDPEAVLTALIDGVALSRFRFPYFRQTDPPSNQTPPLSLAMQVAESDDEAARHAAAINHAVQTARTLAALPPNRLNPRTLAEHAERLADAVGLACTIHDETALERMGLRGLLTVGAAGSTPPRLIQLDWTPPHASPDEPPTLVVGKAVTFDSGGYNLKPTGGKGMKYDKCGGMAAIGIAEAVARLHHPRRLVALIPAAENLVADSAYRPDDILTLANGLTVEVTNTDAEGRLILADALAWGTAHLHPARVIDLATLTGGARVALGDDTAALFCNDPRLTHALDDAATLTGERIWRLPLWPKHRQLLKSTHADIVNSGERTASSIQGAIFLSHFVGPDAPTRMPDLPWAHLDIASTATSDGNGPIFNKGPTGFGVRLVTQALRTLDEPHPTAADTVA